MIYRRLLQVQRDLYDIPRGRARFDAYIEALRDAESDEMKLPLSAMNPMGHDHLPRLLDDYLALGVDALAADWIAPFAAARPSLDAFQVALVLADDARGQWTNRWTTDFAHRFESRPLHRRKWIVGLLWSSEAATVEGAKAAIETAVQRAAYIEANGYATTLGDMLAQETAALQGTADSPLDEDEITYSRTVIAPHLASENQAVQMACLYGDEAAEALGYEKMGLSANAAFQIVSRDTVNRVLTG